MFEYNAYQSTCNDDDFDLHPFVLAANSNLSMEILLNHKPFVDVFLDKPLKMLGITVLGRSPDPAIMFSVVFRKEISVEIQKRPWLYEEIHQKPIKSQLLLVRLGARLTEQCLFHLSNRCLVIKCIIEYHQRQSPDTCPR